MTSTDLFTRLAATHKPDCLLSLEGPAPEAVPDPDGLAQTLGSDAAGRYARDCRPIYEDLRRVIGQLAGLLILAQLTARTEVGDLRELDLCRRRWQQATDRLAMLAPPAGLERHRRQLASAHDFAGAVLGGFDQLRPRGDNAAQFDAMSLRIKRAYAHLEAASAPKAGLQMVDFTHACCSCGA